MVSVIPVMYMASHGGQPSSDVPDAADDRDHEHGSDPEAEMGASEGAKRVELHGSDASSVTLRADGCGSGRRGTGRRIIDEPTRES